MSDPDTVLMSIAVREVKEAMADGIRIAAKAALKLATQIEGADGTPINGPAALRLLAGMFDEMLAEETPDV